MRLLRFLFFRRRRKAESAPIREEDAYARSYGERTGEVVAVVRAPEPPQAEPEPEPELEQADSPPELEHEAEPEPESEPDSEARQEPETDPDPKRLRSRTGELTGELLRCAFEAKLDARGRAKT